MRVVKEVEPCILSQDFQMQCFLRLSIRQSKLKQLTSRLETIRGVEIKQI